MFLRILIFMLGDDNREDTFLDRIIASVLRI